MWEENLLLNIKTPNYVSLTDRLKYISRKYTLLELDILLTNSL